jgi:hypothetical protein
MIDRTAAPTRETAETYVAITPDVDAVFHFAADKNAARDDVDQFRRNNALTETVVERMDDPR